MAMMRSVWGRFLALWAGKSAAHRVGIVIGVLILSPLLLVGALVGLTYELVAAVDRNHRLTTNAQWAASVLAVLGVLIILSAVSPRSPTKVSNDTAAVGQTATPTIGAPSPALASAATAEPVTAEPVTTAPTSTPTATPNSTPMPSVVAKKLTVGEVAQVKSILSGNLKHYQNMFAAGRAALGSTPYPDALTGLAAMDNPTSSAAKFRDWRSSSNVQNDLTYLDAFTKADAYYNADNEPNAIANWRDDMGTATGDLYEWVNVAAGWQISDKTDSDLADATNLVKADFAQVQQDIDTVVTQSK
jgi:hypothetical protein